MGPEQCKVCKGLVKLLICVTKLPNLPVHCGHDT